MQYTKPMIDLIYEIRRRVNADLKPSVKMANPELLKELVDYHHQTKDNVTKALIKELLFLAGDEWSHLLHVDHETTKEYDIHMHIRKQTVMVYRGQTVLIDAPSPSDSDNSHHLNQTTSPTHRTDKPQRIYRGQPVLV